MSSTDPVRVLVVSDRPDDTPMLVEAIADRAHLGPARFHVLVPNPARAEWHPLDPERGDHIAETRKALEDVLPSLQAAAGGPVTGSVSIRADVMDAVESAQDGHPFDEIVLITLPHEIERRLHVDLPHRLAHLGVPITTVVQPHTAPASA